MFVFKIILMNSVFAASANFIEDIFKPGTSGKQVVDHVVDVIGQSCILDNEIFLRRMADVETSYGTDGDTYRQGYDGGIWNIGSDLFDLTRQNPKLINEYDIIKKNLNIDWSNVTWSDLRKPIYSGLAASLLVLSKNIRNIPESAELQATIWSLLRPGNTAFDFFTKARISESACTLDKILDLVIVLDFQKLPILDLVNVEAFLEAFLRRLPLSDDGTKVAIVTKKLMPVAGWYLDSSKPGFTILDGLKALRYTEGPTTVGDSLMFALDTMFSAAHGARDNAARAVLLVTDTVTQHDYAKTVVKNLTAHGISLIAVQVDGNNTATSDGAVDNLVSSPACRNSRHVTYSQYLKSVIERLDAAVCKVPMVLKNGNVDFPCSTSMTAVLMDTTDSANVMVSASNSNIRVYASRKYSQPDEAGYDVRLDTGPASSTTPVLYIRGTNPIYIHVTSTDGGNLCSGIYSVSVKTGADLFQGLSGLCMVGGTIRSCNDLDMGFITHDVVLLSGQDVPDLCDPKNHTAEYFPHPTDTKKFIFCDQHNNAFIGLCPVNLPKCQMISSGCKYSNPCTSQAILDKNLMHADPCGNDSNYVSCTHFGIAELSSCPTGRMWNQDTNYCVFRYVRDATQIGSPPLTNMTNPCIHEHADHVYFPFPGNPKMYILCDVHGNALARECKEGMWNQITKTCTTVSPPSVVG